MADEKGLYLLVNVGKYWRMNYRHDGKRKTRCLIAYADEPLWRGVGQLGDGELLQFIEDRASQSEDLRTREQARADVFDYIERFYNPTRRHSTLGYVSPVQFEEASKA